MDTVKNFFKYVDVKGASSIIKDGTLLFSSPHYFNDPFDISIQTLFGCDPLNLDGFLDEFVNLVFSNEDLGVPNGSKEAVQFNKMRTALENCSYEYKIEMRNRLISEEIWSKDKLEQKVKEVLAIIKNSFDCSGIFCASKRYDNYLLWAHYADKHQGVVLEFNPNVEKDSMLRLVEEVKYSSDRPFLYENQKDFLMKSMFNGTTAILAEYTKKITKTKSIEWAYEEEVRLYQAMLVNVLEGKKNRCLTYHNDELRAIYLGCKMESETRKNIINMAKERNKEIQVFEMIPDPHHYKLIPRAI